LRSLRATDPDPRLGADDPLLGRDRAGRPGHRRQWHGIARSRGDPAGRRRLRDRRDDRQAPAGRSGPARHDGRPACGPRATMGCSLAVAALVLAPYAALDRPHRLPSAAAIAAVVVLGIVCTAIAFVIFVVLIREAGTSRATVITYVNPVIAVALGVLVLGEHPGAGAVAGLLLILAGSWLSTGGRWPPMLGRRMAPGRFRRRRRPGQVNMNAV